MIKTIKDLEKMKTAKMNIFGTQYEHLIRDLEHDLITKYDGEERVAAKLSEWDEEAQQFIMSEVLRRINKSDPNKTTIDFSKDCSVLFFFITEEGKSVMVHYERPQHADDITLGNEARINANDMLEKKLGGVKELVAIAVARSEAQRKELMDQIGFREIGKGKL